MAEAPVWPRHALVRVEEAAWAAALAGHAQGGLALLQGWAVKGWPAIIRRPLPCDAPGLVPLGVPLPPAQGKQRIALAVPASAILAASPPPPLAQAAIAAPADWQPRIAALLALGTQYGIAPACFGGLAWQHLTGLAYLSPSSDLDTIWSLGAADVAPALAADLAQAAAGPGPRLDGELLFPGGQAVNWREFHAAGPQDMLLVKEAQRARLLPRVMLLAA